MRFLKRLFFVFATVLSFIPMQVFAHGTAEEHEKEVFLSNYIAIGSGILFAVFLICYLMMNNKIQKLNVKKQEQRNKKNQLLNVSKKLKLGWILSLIVVILSGGWMLVNKGLDNASVITFKHVHGLGFTNDGEQIYIPAHDGLTVYSDGKWSIPEGEKHDYMGFSMVDEGFYSSGHPAPGSDMPNPFGVIKSTDEGKTLETLDLLGETDFHGMAVGYRSHAIYVLNPEANTRMPEAGMYYTTDETKTWTKSNLNGIDGTPTSLAVHPDKEEVVSLGTENGVYLSDDYGNKFEKVVSDVQVTGVSFDSEGNLLVGGVSSNPVLIRYNMDKNTSENISIPPMEEDAVQYAAANPEDSNEIVITTFNKDVYLTKDTGGNWVQIASKGKGLDQNKE